MGSLAAPSIRKVAIIGAGPGGVAAAKYLRAEQRFDQIDVFEQQDIFGGVWTFCPKDAHPELSIPHTSPNAPPEKPVSSNMFLTPMYEGLEANIPYHLMEYSDFRFSQAHQLFPERQTVLQYLEEYGEDVRDLVQFKTQVIDVQRRHKSTGDVWDLETKRIGSDKLSRHDYDAVVVANGHYSVPYIPNIKGITDWSQAYPDIMAHSKFYQNPTSYKDKKVIVVGNSASGSDIAQHISTVARNPVLNSNRSESLLSFDAPWKKMVPEIIEFISPLTKNRAVRFKDGSIETDIDAVLFCTGYFYSFPFLSSLQLQVIDTGERVKHLFRHIFHIEHPSLAFIGLPSKILPFRTFESQAAVIARVWTDRLALPLQVEMRQWEEQQILKRGLGKQFHTLKFPQDFDYHNGLIDWASRAEDSGRGKLPTKWTPKERWQRARYPLIRKLFSERGEDRHRVNSLEELGFDYDQATEEEKQREDT